MVELGRVFRADRTSHIKTIQPHLVCAAGILMPEASFRSLRQIIDGRNQRIQRDLIAFIPCFLIQLKQQNTRLNIVHLARIPLDNGAVGAYFMIHPGLKIVIILLLARQMPGFLHSG